MKKGIKMPGNTADASPGFKISITPFGNYRKDEPGEIASKTVKKAD